MKREDLIILGLTAAGFLGLAYFMTRKKEIQTTQTPTKQQVNMAITIESIEIIT